MYAVHLMSIQRRRKIMRLFAASLKASRKTMVNDDVDDNDGCLLQRMVTTRAKLKWSN